MNGGNIQQSLQLGLKWLLHRNLVEIKDYRIRKVITKLRLGKLPLQIEKGRHTKPKTPLEKRICSYCNTNSIEDELHFIIYCPFYDEERKFLMNIISSKICIDHKDTFVNIMCNNDVTVLFSLGKYIQKCLKKRL